MEKNDKRTDAMNEQFDSTVREKITGFEPVVPHALWNRIAAELDTDTATTDDTHTIPHHHESGGGFRHWRLAAAAVIILTLTLGTLLYTTGGKNANNIAPTVATQTAPTTIQQTHISVQQPVSTHTVAQSSLSHSSNPAATAAQTVSKHETATAPALTIAVNENPAITPTSTQIKPVVTQSDLTASEKQEMDATPITSQNNPVEVGNIPMYSLNFLSTPRTVNDEITIIKSNVNKKKKHRANADDESTKVIMLGKKYDSQPDIKYQIPRRF